MTRRLGWRAPWGGRKRGCRGGDEQRSASRRRQTRRAGGGSTQPCARRLNRRRSAANRSASASRSYRTDPGRKLSPQEQAQSRDPRPADAGRGLMVAARLVGLANPRRARPGAHPGLLPGHLLYQISISGRHERCVNFRVPLTTPRRRAESENGRQGQESVLAERRQRGRQSQGAASCALARWNPRHGSRLQAASRRAALSLACAVAQRRRGLQVLLQAP